MTAPCIVVVEDAPDALALLQFHLRKEGYKVRAATNGEAALTLVASAPPDLILLDVVLPDMNGLEICRRLKADTRTRDVPVVMLTVKMDDADIIAGLQAGADDYVTKPFNPDVLIARVEAALRRGRRDTASPDKGPVDDTITVGELVIRPGRHEAFVSGERVELTAGEFKLLYNLAQRPGLVFTRQQLLDAMHGDAYVITPRAIDVQVLALRRKLGPAGAQIETVRGVGYRLLEDQSVSESPE